MLPLTTRRKALIALAPSMLLASCASPSVNSRIESPGPRFSGGEHPTRVLVLARLLPLSDRTNAHFRRAFQVELHGELAQSKVESAHVWQADDGRSADDLQRPQPATAQVYPSIETARSLRASHVLTCGATLDSILKERPMYLYWQLLDAKDHYLLWSVHTSTGGLHADLPAEPSVAAGRALAKVLAAELRAREVIARAAPSAAVQASQAMPAV